MGGRHGLRSSAHVPGGIAEGALEASTALSVGCPLSGRWQGPTTGRQPGRAPDGGGGVACVSQAHCEYRTDPCVTATQLPAASALAPAARRIGGGVGEGACATGAA